MRFRDWAVVVCPRGTSLTRVALGGTLGLGTMGGRRLRLDLRGWRRKAVLPSRLHETAGVVRRHRRREWVEHRGSRRHGHFRPTIVGIRAHARLRRGDERHGERREWRTTLRVLSNPRSMRRRTRVLVHRVDRPIWQLMRVKHAPGARSCRAWWAMARSLSVPVLVGVCPGRKCATRAPTDCLRSR